EYILVLDSGADSCSVKTTRASGKVIRSKGLIGLRRPSEFLGVEERVGPKRDQFGRQVQ
ncbi:unnamed protein product, partial [Polarella glacialis]